MLEYIKHCLICTFTPSSWFGQRANKNSDKFINEIIDNGEYLIQDDYTVKFKYKNSVIELWIGNYPYSYGFVYSITPCPYKLVYGMNKFAKDVPFIQTRKKLKSFCKTND